MTGDEEELHRLLAVPYVAVFSSTVDETGTWVRCAEYPELPGCAVRAPSAVEAAERLEELRVDMLVAAFHRGEMPVPPREPLPGGTSGLSAQTLRTLLRRARNGDPPADSHPSPTSPRLPPPRPGASR